MNNRLKTIEVMHQFTGELLLPLASGLLYNEADRRVQVSQQR